jgi:hypothetical protein
MKRSSLQKRVSRFMPKSFMRLTLDTYLCLALEKPNSNHLKLNFGKGLKPEKEEIGMQNV